VLGSRTLSNLFARGLSVVMLFASVRHDGRSGLRTGRWWRGVKPPELKARRGRE